jgi:hypothetical protein
MIKCGTCDDGILFSQKKNEILSFVTMWMELESFTLRKKKANTEHSYHIFLLIHGISKS